MQLRLQVPEQLSGKNQQQLEALAFEALVVRLYALGELSSGEGAKLLSLTRREFLDLLGHSGRDQHNPADHSRRGWAP